ncbi:MAG: DEAD/DEAH box helicase [Chloroflexi bacterium]|nr:DEAD/DEAH box helicase [Chloroflexota bacterium]
MPLADLLDRWRNDPQFARNVAAWKTIPARAARLGDFPVGLHPRLAEALRARGIHRLYTHQIAAWDAVQAGRHVAVVTGTASGKTLCYNLPVLDRLLREPETRALYLFPTKALAQDQAATLRGFAELWSLAVGERHEASADPLVATYDGDTPVDKRPAVRTGARIVITNPDMLHTGILPHHTKWAHFFERLRFIVIDEMHALRGVFGSHVANVLRRLKRIAQFYGASPQFILASATIANPVELAGRLVEEDVALVDDDGAPRGEKHFVIYNPPVVNRDLGLRRSALLEAVRIGNELLNRDIQTILFARSRRSVELLLSYLQQLRPLENLLPGGDSSTPLRAYRGGYLPSVRREIERGLRDGSVRGVVATNALELGVDIGQMGASVMVGYPGNIAATWQQAGRAGRTATDSLALLVVTAAPIDQYLAHHPSWFFTRTPEHGLINPDNLIILVHHLRCAAFELPFQKGESFGHVEGARVKEFLDFLADEGALHSSGDRYYYMSEKYPADQVSLRSASPDTVVIQTAAQSGGDDAGDEPVTTLGEVDLHSAYWMLHPQAIYLHEGQSYFCAALDLERKVAEVRRVDADYYTEPRQEVTIELVEQAAVEPATGGAKYHGEVKVTSQLIGFRKIKLFTHENLGTGEVQLPPTELITTGYWLSVADETVERLREAGLWSNDRNDYGPNWQEQRRKTRERDNFRCRNCGVAETDAEHHVHHIQPFRTFGGYLAANQLSNLLTLCPPCHARAETAVRVRSGLAGVSFALAHLAPLFLMCDPRDIGVHSDPRSPLADGQPAVVVYDNVAGGIGLSERLYELHAELLARTRELVRACDCTDGCPSCVGPAGESGEGGKRETLALLDMLH